MNSSLLSIVLFATMLLGLVCAQGPNTPTMKTRWNVTVGKLGTNSPFYYWHVRNVAPDAAVMAFSSFQASGKFLVLNTSTGETLASSPEGSFAFYNSLTAMVADETSGLVGHLNTEQHYCVSQGKTLENLWCTSFASYCTPSTTPNQQACDYTITPHMFYLTDGGVVYGFAASSGQLMWKAKLPDTNIPDWQAASITASESQVVVAFGGLYGFNARTGKLEFSLKGTSSFAVSRDNAFTAEGNIAVNAVRSALLVSPAGKVVQNFTFPTTRYPTATQVVVDPSTSELYCATVDYGMLLKQGVHPDMQTMRENVNRVASGGVASPIGNNYPHSIFAVRKDNTLKWSLFTDGVLGNVHLDLAKKALFYTNGGGLARTDMETGKVTAYATNVNDYRISGQPWVSTDGKTVVAASYYFNHGDPANPGFEAALGFVLE